MNKTELSPTEKPAELLLGEGPLETENGIHTVFEYSGEIYQLALSSELIKGLAIGAVRGKDGDSRMQEVAELGGTALYAWMSRLNIHNISVSGVINMKSGNFAQPFTQFAEVQKVGENWIAADTQSLTPAPPNI